MGIEVVLFDYSGVLTTSLHLPVDDVPYDPDAVVVEMVTALSTTDLHPWQELERGEISLASYIEYAEALVPGVGVLFDAGSAHNVMGSLELRNDRLALAQELRSAGLRVGLMTNNVAEWRSLWRPRLPEGVFEVIIDSAEVGCRKPEPAIYELALAGFGGVDPTTVCFIDDFEWNVAGATEVGMIGIHCTADTDLRREVLGVIAGGR